MPRRSRLTPEQQRQRERERKQRERGRAVDEAGVHLQPRKSRPDTAEDIAKTHADDLWARKQFREASIASCDKLLRLLKKHHPRRERAHA